MSNLYGFDVDDPGFDPAQLAQLSDEQKQELVDRWSRVASIADEKEECEASLYEFVKRSWSSIDPSIFQDSWAIQALCEHLEAITLGQISRLLTNYPPRCAKTAASSICWPAWTWARRQKSFWSGPQVRFLCASYNEKLSLLAANRSRRLILSPWYVKRWGSRFGLMWDQAAKGHFDNTKQGSRISTSVGGSLLGLGGDIINVDDPHNTETEKVVESDADRKKVASWSQELFSTRLNDPKKSAIAVTMQRLHEEDLSGIILSGGEDWVHLMIPQEFDSARRCVTVLLPAQMRRVEDGGGDEEPWSDPRKEDGELMWPERFGPDEIERLKTQLGPFMYSGRMQQMPVPKGGGIIKREWWQPWDAEEAARYGLEWTKQRREFPHTELVVASLDTNFGVKEENDYNACTVWGIFNDKGRNRRAMLMFAWNKRLQLHGEPVTAIPGEAKVQFQERQKAAWGLIELLADTCKRYRVNRILIENKARGYDVAQEIRRLYKREKWDVELVDPVKDKVSRGHSVVPLFTDKSVYAPDTVWAESAITQCALVPKAQHDDIYDSVTQFLLWARENGILVRGDEMSGAIDDEMQYRVQQQTVAEHYGV